MTFTPTASGGRAASIALTDNALDSPQIISVTGMGPFRQRSASSNNVVFAGQTVGTSSLQTVTVTNSGTQTLTLTSITLSGANSGDFNIGQACGASLAAGAELPDQRDLHPHRGRDAYGNDHPD